MGLEIQVNMKITPRINLNSFREDIPAKTKDGKEKPFTTNVTKSARAQLVP